MKLHVKRLNKVSNKEINGGKTYLEIGYSPRFADKDLRKIVALNRKEWVVKTGKDIYTRRWYCTPDTVVYISKEEIK